ncbi:conserved hypothetical protein [Ahrensia sp. R2A130]|nr:conserved hypothetical protein [Ahrensia sp. R2A130]
MAAYEAIFCTQVQRDVIKLRETSQGSVALPSSPFPFGRKALRKQANI